MDENNKAAVIIPFYKTQYTPYENMALQQCFKILSGHPVIAVKPHHLHLPAEVTQYPFSNVISFDDDYFKDIQGYNRLMLDAAFYKEFLAYEYQLIYQLDAFVFKDDLDYWCSQGIDYVGAPWMRAKDYPNVIKAVVSQGLQYLAKRYDLKKHGLPSKKQFDNNVGNGGFSLRKVKVFHDLCIKYRDAINEYNKRDSHHYNEDAFWSIELNRKQKAIKIPGYKKALQFAFELAPMRAYKINGQQLPFGCHAWDLNVDFWRPIFAQYGYII